MSEFKFALAGLALRALPGRGSHAAKLDAAEIRREPLPPIIALEGNPDPSLRDVIEALAGRLGASICMIEGPAALASDPDLDAVVAVILTRARSPLELQVTLREARGLLGERPLAVLSPQPLTSSFGGILPVDSACVAPPITVDRLLFALGLAPDSRA